VTGTSSTRCWAQPVTWKLPRSSCARHGQLPALHQTEWQPTGITPTRARSAQRSAATSATGRMSTWTIDLNRTIAGSKDGSDVCAASRSMARPTGSAESTGE